MILIDLEFCNICSRFLIHHTYTYKQVKGFWLELTQQNYTNDERNQIQEVFRTGCEYFFSREYSELGRTYFRTLRLVTWKLETWEIHICKFVSHLCISIHQIIVWLWLYWLLYLSRKNNFIYRSSFCRQLSTLSCVKLILSS